MNIAIASHQYTHTHSLHGQMGFILASSQLHACVCALLAEEEDHEAGLHRGTGHAADQPGPECTAPREVRPGKLHCVGRQVCRRVLQFQKKEDSEWGIL